MITSRRKLGTEAEHKSESYLRNYGLTPITRNFHCRLGEIDLIMRDKTTLVFVEVRSRSKQDTVHPLETVHFHKQQKIAKTAAFYLSKNQHLHSLACRFDVLALISVGEDFHINWVQDAFQPAVFETY